MEEKERGSAEREEEGREEPRARGPRIHAASLDRMRHGSVTTLRTLAGADGSAGAGRAPSRTVSGGGPSP